MLSGRKEGRPGRQAGRTRHIWQICKIGIQDKVAIRKEGGAYPGKKQGRQDAGKHTYMQDIQAGMKQNRHVDSSHACRLPDGTVGGQKGRQESK